ncbi:MAG TPA: serine/threonine-protein kinase, partial [Chroococcales cyanobacterium]
IDSSFAEGGMAVLYLAHHISMEREVVVKVMHGDLLYRPEAIERFKRECKFVARLNHPNIISVYDFGFIADKQPYLVMEYLKGQSLADHLEDFGSFEVPVALKIISQVCYGLEEAHETGIIHRDLKPENIILQEKSERPDWVKIVDFGIAHLLDNTELKRLTRVGFITGTPEYMAPEQFSDKQLDTRCDIYALGAVLFELLTGHPPFESEDCGALMAKHLLEPPKPISQLRADIPAGTKIEQIILKCLEKDPAKRFQKVSDLRRAVEGALS